MSRNGLMPRYGFWVTRLRGNPVVTNHGLCQGTVPCDSSPVMRSVMRSYDLMFMSFPFGWFVKEPFGSMKKPMSARHFAGDGGTCQNWQYKKPTTLFMRPADKAFTPL